MTRRMRKHLSGGGFTLIELLVVVLIIGILAAIAVPQYFRVVERGRATEAITIVHSLKGAQERFLLKSAANGYTTALSSLDLTVPTPKFFTVGPLTTTATPSWTMVLTRAPAANFYGAYIVTFNSTAVVPFTCSGGLNSVACQTDLMPQ